MGAPCLLFYLNTLPNLPFGPKQSAFLTICLSALNNHKTSPFRCFPSHLRSKHFKNSTPHHCHYLQQLFGWAE
jgi:hypothetical protein